MARWTIVIFKLDDPSSRHRMALRREFQRLGATHLQRGVWLVPVIGDRDQLLRRIYSLVRRADGHVLLAKPDLCQMDSEALPRNAIETITSEPSGLGHT